MEYRNLAQLTEATTRGCSLLPRDIDLVIGIPRSGMLPATIIALNRNLPLAEMSTFLRGQEMAGGYRYQHFARPHGPPRKVLLVDDSALSGSAMNEAFQQLRAMNPEVAVISAVV